MHKSDIKERQQHKEEEKKKNEKFASELGKYESDRMHREQERKAKREELQAHAEATTEVRTRPDTAGAHKREQRSAINVDLNDPNVQLLAAFLVVLGILGLALCAFAIFA